MKAVFENERLVAVDKPPGWLTVPSRAGEADPRPCLGRQLERELGVRLWPVHRLDVEVSGLVLFAKDAEAHRAANAWFEGRSVSKVYEALTEGALESARVGHPVEWRSSLQRGKRRTFESPHGKPAVTRATCLGPRPDGALFWRLEPLTGRPHQLRVHLAVHGFPIVGDMLYGARRPHAGEGIALRAVRLDFSACAEAARLGLPPRLEVEGLCGP